MERVWRGCLYCSSKTHYFVTCKLAGAKQPVHWYLTGWINPRELHPKEWRIHCIHSKTVSQSVKWEQDHHCCLNFCNLANQQAHRSKHECLHARMTPLLRALSLGFRKEFVVFLIFVGFGFWMKLGIFILSLLGFEKVSEPGIREGEFEWEEVRSGYSLGGLFVLLFARWV